MEGKSGRVDVPRDAGTAPIAETGGAADRSYRQQPGREPAAPRRLVRQTPGNRRFLGPRGFPVGASPAVPDPSVQRAACFLRRGGLVLFPTETVYGLGASLWSPGAVHRIYRCKERSREKPLLWHLGSLRQAAELGLLPGRREMLRFLPGPLSLLLPAPDWAPAWSQREGRIGLRVVADPVGSAFLQAVGVPVLATSANRSGQPSSLTPETALHTTRSCHPLLLTGGGVQGLESTLLDLTGAVPVVRRRGGVPVAALRNLLPDLRVEIPPKPLAGLILLVGSRAALRKAADCLQQPGDQVAAPAGLLPGTLPLEPPTLNAWQAAREHTPLWVCMPWDSTDQALRERLWHSAEKVMPVDEEFR